ncbi:MAG: YitT family protein [Chloroflexi bacterium]|nr:YitT family protein [Chloroflexota bacterium]MCC6892981.1 YitT family protein [Anaerolineae bacterium]
MSVQQPRRLITFSVVTSYVMLVIAATIEAASVNIFFAPFQIAPGGVSGVAVILNHLDPRLPIGLLILLGNIPIQIYGYRMLGGWRVVIRTVVYIILYSVLVEFLKPYVANVQVGTNVLLNAVFGGILGGISGGLVLRAGGTQGGTATLGRILQQKFGLPLSSSSLYTEALVIMLAGLVFGWEGALYAIIALFVNGATADYVLEGPSVIRTATIITDNPDAISSLVMDEMGRGVTSWQGKGMFTEQSHTVLFITVSRSQVNSLQRLVNKADPNAFMVVGQGHVAYGEGFRRVKSPD